jgi:hypothetical protein
MKSRTKNGVLLYLSSRDPSDTSNYALVELVNGELVYKLVLNDQENVVKFTPELSRAQLCNSSWIRLRLKLDHKGGIALELRGVESTNTFPQDLGYLMAKLKEHASLYVGALPTRMLYTDVSQSNEAFVGCVRDLVVQKKRGGVDVGGGLPSKVLLEMTLDSGVLNYCPLK